MKKSQVVRRLTNCALVAMMMLGGVAAGHAYTSKPVTLDINVPHNSTSKGAHNLVTFTLDSYDATKQSAKVTISGSGIPSSGISFTVKIGEDTPVAHRGGDGGVGGLQGKLRLVNPGAFQVVMYIGKMNSWAGYGFQSYVEFTESAPLTVGVTDGK